MLSGMLYAKSPLIQHFIIHKGESGYDTFRIPTVVTANDGTVFVFCEGRKDSSSDHGTIDIVYKTLSGGNWSTLQIAASDNSNTYRNPCPIVIDDKTIMLVYCWDDKNATEKDIMEGKYKTRVFWMEFKKIDGVWKKQPGVEITDQVKDSSWRWFATGPANGIVLQSKPHEGRIVIPCCHSSANSDNKQKYAAHAIYSDDNGGTWNHSSSLEWKYQTDESTVVELDNGDLLMNSRMQDSIKSAVPEIPYRGISISTDYGNTWKPAGIDYTLTSPLCEAAFIRYCWPKDNPYGRNKSIFLFSGPDSITPLRVSMRVRAAVGDDINSPLRLDWECVRYLNYLEWGAYSGLTKMPNGDILCIYEANEKYMSSLGIRAAVFPLSWLLGDSQQTEQELSELNNDN